MVLILVNVSNFDFGVRNIDALLLHVCPLIYCIFYILCYNADTFIPHRLPNLLVNRLYLNLRRMSQEQLSTTSKSSIGISEPKFAQNRFIGNIGAPLDPIWWENQFDEDDDPNDTSPVGQEVSTLAPGGSELATFVPVVSRSLLKHCTAPWLGIYARLFANGILDLW